MVTTFMMVWLFFFAALAFAPQGPVGVVCSFMYLAILGAYIVRVVGRATPERAP